jgi:hypothetical protein
LEGIGVHRYFFARLGIQPGAALKALQHLGRAVGRLPGRHGRFAHGPVQREAVGREGLASGPNNLEGRPGLGVRRKAPEQASGK